MELIFIPVQAKHVQRFCFPDMLRGYWYSTMFQVY